MSKLEILDLPSLIQRKEFKGLKRLGVRVVLSVKTYSLVLGGA